MGLFFASLPRGRAGQAHSIREQNMTHALDGIVGQLTVWCSYLFNIAGFEDLTKSPTQFVGIGRLHGYGFVIFLESEVRSGEVMLAGDVDEGPPFGVCEVYAYLHLCR